MNIDNNRRQHKELRLLIAAIGDLLETQQWEVRASELSSKVDTLAGRIKIHLVAEERFVYPRLAESDQEDIRGMASSFQAEMGVLGGEIAAYREQYDTAGKILEDPQRFARETLRMIGVLSHRLDQEDDLLYPLAQQM